MDSTTDSGIRRGNRRLEVVSTHRAFGEVTAVWSIGYTVIRRGNRRLVDSITDFGIRRGNRRLEVISTRRAFGEVTAVWNCDTP